MTASTLDVRLSHPITIGSEAYPVNAVVTVDATLGRRLVFAGLATYSDAGATIDPDTFSEGIRDILEAALRPGDNIEIVVDDIENTITIVGAGTGASYGYLVYDSVTNTYPTRTTPEDAEEPLPGTFVGPVNPADVGAVGVDGDVWINTREDNPEDDNVYLTAAELAGAISAPGPVRDALAAAVAAAAASLPQIRGVASVPRPGQTVVDEFDTDAVSTSWVRVDPSGTDTRVNWAQGGGALSALHTGGDPSGLIHTLIRQATIEVGEALETRVRIHCQANAATPMCGIVVASAGDVAAATVMASVWRNTSDENSNVRQQTSYTSAGADGTVVAPVNTLTFANGTLAAGVFIRLRRTSANTWDMLTSPDGIQWVLRTRLTNTLAPTHLGLFVSSWTSGLPAVFVFDYLRKVAA